MTTATVETIQMKVSGMKCSFCEPYSKCKVHLMAVKRIWRWGEPRLKPCH